MAVLIFASFGLYLFFWLLSSWRALKRELADDGMSPVGHAVAMVVPIYGLFRLHAHMRTIKELAASTGARVSLSPGWCVAVWTLVNVMSAGLDQAGRRGPEPPFWVDLLPLYIAGAVVLWAQSALNTAWRRLPGGARPKRTHPLEWTVLVLGSLFWVLALIGTLFPDSDPIRGGKII